MPKFMLMLFEKPAAYADFSPAQMQAVVKEYGDWARKLAQEGKFVGGDKLADDPGKLLRSSAGKVSVTDGPFAETKEVLGGYFIINASSYDEAVAIAQSCPHIKYGSSTLIRQTDPT